MKPEHYVFIPNEVDSFTDIYNTKILDNYVKLDLELHDKDGKLINGAELHIQILSELYMPLVVKRFNPFDGKLSLTIGNEHLAGCDAMFIIRLKSDNIIDTTKSKVDIEFLSND
ncbi:MAG: hypothetical protein APG12_00756 [Candidatus Methanofastidiosum methylothiophilum]|uniref:Uncharacterized protein n=1 Tax=Candidatus Methanofastidiosum methylothiophilum TaxID=1705564 RepID=A0A150ILF9_9EURY|nr:MAG: hypothetical protein APG10_00699 [Candidatus Methanofastidiosum methylthiophilus]KYC47748.1 MAG: hypothetical protein APG11_00917 [Candidatus Methanofastidiosum methylthiophilus]KYC50519.1 MAG: hypothetical protein APG12_00756 [Candidatus Methanofastidiosum methylthiophilus]